MNASGASSRRASSKESTSDVLHAGLPEELQAVLQARQRARRAAEQHALGVPPEGDHGRDRAARARARARLAARIAWWPRCTPSKTPIETTEPPGAGSGRSASSKEVITACVAGGGGLGRSVALDQGLERGLVAVLVRRRHAVDQQHALEVVVLVLDDAAREAVELALDRLALGAEGPHPAALRADDLGVDLGEREAALLERRLGSEAVEDLGVDQGQVVLGLAARVEHQDALLAADLGRGQAHALASAA